MIARRRLWIAGTVQGVGFRPFLYRLAERWQLGGWVRNSASGVVVEIEGARSGLAGFLSDLAIPPPLARVDEVRVEEIAPEYPRNFEILHSEAGTDEFLLVPPDIATCNECRDDFTRRDDRRFGYPFTNCTNCGPRYTIIRDIPYDRPTTTMAPFRMCAACQTEYGTPGDRRFHAQPNACPACGPRLELDQFEGTDDLDRIREARRRLRAGHVLAIKGLGGFHLACDASNAEAVARLRERKRRSDKPFAVMVRDVAAARRNLRGRRERAGCDGGSAAADRDFARACLHSAFASSSAAQSDAWRDAALHAVAPPAFRRRSRCASRIHRAGNDQRQSE